VALKVAERAAAIHQRLSAIDRSTEPRSRRNPP
jgi:hypothetical protein